MKIKSHLFKAASLSLLISANLHAAELFTPAAGFDAQKAQTSELVASKAYIDGAHLYQVNATALKASTEQLTLSLAPGLTVFADLDKASVSQSGGLLWEGKSSLSPKFDKSKSKLGDSVTLINRKGKITGTVRVDGRLFKIQPVSGDLHRITEVNEDNMKPDHPAGAMAKMEQELAERLANQVEPVLEAQAASKLADPVIRVLVLYTPGVASEVSDVSGLVDLAFAETNTGYTNSGVNATVELAHLAQTSYNSVSISTDLSRLKTSGNGYMEEAHTLRDTHAADIVMLLVPDSGSSCGQAAGIGSTAATAFAVTAQDCATGYYSFGHELGHLQSARHNPETDGSTTPYAFGHGYRDPSSNWRTVMAYNCTSGCSRINWWSNPNNTRSGTAMGTSSTSDNTRVLNLTAATVAGYRGGSSGGTGGSINESNLSASSGNWLRYTANVGSGSSTLNVSISGGSGDADLYTRRGSQPTTSSYDCRPYKYGNNETCTVASPAADTYHIGIRAYSTFSGVSLTASW